MPRWLAKKIKNTPRAKVLLATCKEHAEIREVAQAPSEWKAEAVPPLWRPKTKDPG